MLHGLSSQLLWGSDYPHLEGTFVFAEGREAPSVTRLALRNTFCDVPAAETERMIGGNAIDVYNLDASALRGIARRSMRRLWTSSPRRSTRCPKRERHRVPFRSRRLELNMASVSAPSQLRVEHLGDAALGLGDRRPRLSWSLPDGASHQLAYCVELNGRALDRIDAATACWCHGRTSRSGRQQVEWRVKVWTDLGESDWSTAGVVRDGTSRRRGLGGPSGSSRSSRYAPPSGDAPRTCCGTRSRSTRPRPTRVLYATAHGVYETFLNGQPSRRSSSSRRASPPTRPVSMSRRTTSRISSSPVRTSGPWCSATVGTAAAPGTGRCPTTTATPSPSSGSCTSATPSSPPDADWESCTGRDRRRRPHGRTARGPTTAAEAWHRSPSLDHDLRRSPYSPAPPVRRVQELRPVDVRRHRRATSGRRPRPEHQRLGATDRPRAGRAPS